MPLSTIVFLQSLFLMIILIHGEDSFDCTGYEDDSYHPIFDADDCRRYWHCIYVDTVYMHAVKRVCPAGTEFDATLKKCETSGQVDCVPLKSPRGSRMTTTTKAWKWKYSRLFSQKYRRTTTPYFITTRKRRIFDVGDSVEEDITTVLTPEVETTESMQVLPFTQPPTASTNVFFLEKLSKDFHALLSNRRPHKSRAGIAQLFQPGEPENEAIIYTTTTARQRIRRTRSTTQSTSIQMTTQSPLTTFFITAEPTTITITTAPIILHTTIPTTTTTTTTTTSSATLTAETTAKTQSDTTINISSQSRMNGKSRRNNMTLYILTSDDHKIRRFSINHTRGFLLNCNQLRRRLLGRRRLRDIFQANSTYSPIMRYASTSSRQTFHHNILSLTIISLFFFFLQK
ncbi:unnamed protein product [Rotaria magnacalcarata]|uniref:Chitin-binding type-2 domain-containing protein n=5 Tax=Rotaria magnacalcarata TaxID=392030 RepID=A0A815V6N1_9BILA|nr:unnamed protein product [Rotaria magnacalcarata]